VLHLGLQVRRDTAVLISRDELQRCILWSEENVSHDRHLIIVIFLTNLLYKHQLHTCSSSCLNAVLISNVCNTAISVLFVTEKKNADMEKSLISRSKCHTPLKADNKSDLCSKIPGKNRKSGAPVTL
jgi:hypothetical protein